MVYTVFKRGWKSKTLPVEVFGGSVVLCCCCHVVTTVCIVIITIIIIWYKQIVGWDGCGNLL